MQTIRISSTYCSASSVLRSLIISRLVVIREQHILAYIGIIDVCFNRFSLPRMCPHSTRFGLMDFTSRNTYSLPSSAFNVIEYVSISRISFDSIRFLVWSISKTESKIEVLPTFYVIALNFSLLLNCHFNSLFCSAVHKSDTKSLMLFDLNVLQITEKIHGNENRIHPHYENLSH